MSNFYFGIFTRSKAFLFALSFLLLPAATLLGQVTAPFTYTGSNQTFTVPAGVNSIDVRIWGAGGGGSSYSSSPFAGSAGSGAFVKGTVAVTPGEQFIIIVGGGGIYRSSNGQSLKSFGGGGEAGGSRAGSGGGYSGIFKTTVTSPNARAIAGGGGGGGYYSQATFGGGGGGPNGGNGGPVNTRYTGGFGGSQTAGGGGGLYNNVQDGAPGIALAGGTGFVRDASGGGGGGGGYFGGGGGYGSGSSTYYASGGGGGSSYLGSMSTTTNIGGTTSTNGLANQAPGSSETNYVAGVGNGGSGRSGGTGGNGLIVITYVSCTGPSITTQPAPQSICTGGNVTFNVSANGTAPFNYQWRKNGSDITGATGSSYTINGVTAADGANYSVYIVNTCGNITSGNALLTISTPASITADPVNDTKCVSSTASFSVTATGGPLTYQWQKNNVNIAGAIAANYTTPALVAGDNNATYRVIVTSAGCGSVTSAAATLLVNVPAAITTQPVSQSICAGGPVTFSVATSGTPPLTYQWKKGGVDITGETNASYSIAAVAAGDAGSYTVTITNICNSVTSSAATLTVSTPASITTDPVDQIKCGGATASFSVVATGGPLTYQWQKNNGNIAGATSTNYTTPTLVAGDNNATYKVIVTSAGCGSVTSAVATLTVNVPVSITTQPASQIMCLGSTVTFSVATSGTPPLSYQWKNGGADITGETNATLNIPSVSASDAGSYTVTIANSCNSVTSSAAALTVNTPASVTTAPADQTKCVGQTATFNVVAAGSSPSYQWQKNNVNITGATSASYSTGALVAGDDDATYKVIITVAGCGTVTSAFATLTVNTPPAITTQPALSQTICLGSPASFTVAVTGSPAPSFQWRKNGANIAGATSATYTIPSVAAGDAATYTVVITNTCGTVTSANATMVTTSVGSWIGVTSTNWFTASNWGCGIVPTATTDVTIPATAPFMPNINGGGAVCQDITINGSLTITGANNLDVYGDWVNNNVFTANTSSVTFRGGTGNILAGSAATTFSTLTVNKSATANTLTSTTKAFSAANLNVNQGNLILTSSDVSYIVGNITVPAAGILTDNVNWNGVLLLSVTGNIAIDGIFNYTSGTPHVNMNGAGTKTVRSGTNPASGFGFLTLSTGNYTASGTLTINSNFWAMFGTGGTFTTGTNTINANAGFLNSGGTVTINGGTINVQGGMFAGYSGASGTINFSSGTINTDQLTVGTATPAVNGIFNHSGGTININGNLLINNTTAASVYNSTGSPTINITGDWTNNETFNAGSSQVNFIGTTPQSIGGTSTTTFNNFKIDNAAGASIATNASINNTFNLTDGVITTPGANVITIGLSGNILNASANSYVSGKLAQIYNSNISKVYPVGKGSNYRPITFSYANRTGTSTVTVEQIEGNIGTPVAPATAFTARYWNITQNGGSSLNYKVTLNDPAYTPIGFAKILKKEGTGVINAYDASIPNYTNTGNPAFTTFNGVNNGTNSFALGWNCSSSANAGTALADFCQGGSTPGLGGAISGTATGGTWSSSAGGTFSPAATDLNAIWTPPANYYGTATLTLTPTGGLCAPNTVATKTVNVIQGPSGTVIVTETSGVANNDNIICVGASVKFTAPLGYGYYNFYRVGTTDTLQKGANNILNTSSLINGDQVSIIIANGNNCATTFGPIVFTVIDLPTPGLTASATSICPTGNVTFTATGGNYYIFKVNNSPVQSSASDTYSTTTLPNNASVTVDVRNVNYCIATSAAIVITVNALPVGTLTTIETSGTANDKKVCIGDNVTFTATSVAGNTYDFKINGVSIQGFVTSNTYTTQFTTAGSPVVTVDVKNASGCIAAFGPSQVISVFAAPSGSLIATETSGIPNNEEICAGSSITFTATAGSGNNYKFYKNGTGVPLYNGSANTYSITTLANGEYLTVTVTNSNGCTAVYTSAFINVVEAPTGTLSAPTNPTTTICFGGDIDFVATAGFTNYNFKSNGISFQNGASNTANHTGLAEGNTVTVEVSNGASCIAIFNTLTIHVNPLPTGSLTLAESSGNANNDGIICTDANVVFTATAGFANYNFKLNDVTVQYNATNTYSNSTLTTGDVVSVEVSSAAGCAVTYNTFTLTVHPYDVVAPIIGDAAVCVGNSIPLADATVSGNWSSVHPAIATVSSTGVVTGVSAGTATISYKVINANGCETIVTKDIIVNALPVVAAITGPAAVCAGSNITLANVTEGGVWSSSDETIATVNNSGVVTGVLAGPVIISYTVTNSSNGCVTIVTKNISVNALPIVAAITGTTNVCVGANTALSSSPGGGSWSSSDQTIATVNPFGLVNGVSDGTATITYTVTNGAGCVSSVQAVVNVNALPVPTLSGPNPICPNTTETYTTQPGQTDYTWSVIGGTKVPVTGGGGLTDNFVTILWGPSGTKSVYVNYKNASGCAAAASVTIANGSIPSPTITGDGVVCQNIPGHVYTTETGKAAYTWVINGGDIISGDGTNSVTVTWTDAGNQSITVNYAEIGGCNAATPTVRSVTVNPEPTVIITDPSAVCSPSTVNLTASAIKFGSTPGLTFSYWIDAAATTGVPDPTQVNAGTYYIKGATAAGCFVIKPVQVTVNPTPTVVITNPAAVCSPGTVDLAAPAVTAGSTPGITFTYWTNAAGTTVLSNQTSVGAGTYYIKGTTALGCYEIKPVVVTVNPKPTLVIHNPAALCSPATADLTLTAVTAGSTAGLTYSYWTDAAGTVAYATPAIAVAGTYYIKGITGAGCEDIKPVTVTVNETPSLVITNPTAVCSPATVNLTAAGVTTGSTAGLTFSYWTNASATTAYTTPTTAGAGTYFIKGTTPSGCYDIQPVTVTVNPTPTVVITNPPALCAPSTVNLTLGSVTAGSTGGLTYTYWTDAAATTPYATPATAGAGAYYIKGETGAGCYDIKAVTVTVNPIPTLVINNPAQVCAPATVNLTLPAVTAGSSGGLTFTYWTNAAATASYATPAAAGAGTYYIKATSPAGCYDIKPVTVVVNALPVAFLIEPSSAAICLDGIVPMSASANTAANDSKTFTSGNVNLNIPDDNANGAVSTINVSGIPAGAVITSVSVNFNVPHQYAEDLVLNLKAPNGDRLNLVNTRGTGPNFTNTTISSTSNNPLTNNGQPYSGTYRADGNTGIGANGNSSNVNNFSALYDTPNGNWTFSARDVKGCHGSFFGCLFGGGDYYTGSINSWSITINYSVPNAPLSVTWSPIADLYTNASATTAYTGTGASTVYAKPATSGSKIYTATITNAAGCNISQNVTVTVSPTPVVSIATNYCVVPGKVRLTASSIPVATNYIWSTGATTASIDVDIAGSFDVTLFSGAGCSGTAVIDVAQELVTNGDFEAGDGGFTTLYTSHTGSFYNGTNGSGLYPDGYYAIDKNAWSPSNGIGYHPSFHGRDHTTGSGKFMMVNGSKALVKIWEQTVPVLPNTTYYFSAWGMNLNPNSPAILRFTVNTIQTGSTLDLNAAGTDKPTNEAGVNLGNWKRFYGTWTSGPTTTSAVISIINLNTDPGGNDFGLDDISFATLSTFIDLLSAEGTDAQTVCVNTPITNIVYRAGNGDINGPNVTGLPAGVTKSFVGDRLTISGTPTIPGDYTYTITTTGCAPFIVTGTIKVETQTLTLSAGTSSPTLCINSALSTLEYTIGGSATGVSITAGAWPTGVDGLFNAGKFTIIGTPTVAGIYPYTLTTTGTCEPTTISGTITVQEQEIALTSGEATQEVCINQDISPVIYTVSGTGSGAVATDLPPGVTGFYSGGVFIISGKPIAPAAGIYNFTVTTTGTCSPVATISGSITVNPAATINLSSGAGSDNQAICINSGMTAPIKYTIGGGGTDATVSGLPAGVSGTYNSGVLTINGTPSVAGTFNYTVTTTGTCAQVTATGILTVNTQTIALTSGNASPTLCIGSALTNIVFTTGGTATSAILTGTLPIGVTGSLSGNTFTISGSPTELGTFNYTITTIGTCATASVNGTIVVNTGSIGGNLPVPLAVCSGASGTLNLTGNTGNVSRWESSTDNGATWNNITNATTTLPYTNITVPTQYRALVKSGSCNAVYSTIALVAIINYWTGAIDADWQTAGNWSDNQLPGLSCPNVYIPNTANDPVLANGSSTIGNIYIYAGAVLTVNGTGTLQIAGTINNTGTFDARVGEIELNGTVVQNLGVTTFMNNAVKDLKVSNATGVNVNSDLDIYGSLSFGSTNARINTNGNLTLKSNINNTAWVGQMTGTQIIDGDVTVERFINTGVGGTTGAHRKSWQLLAVPTDGGQTINQAWQDTATFPNEVRYPGYGTMIVSNAGGNQANATALGFDQYTAPGPSIKVYNATTGGYDGPPNTISSPIYNKKGYMITVRGDRSVFTSTAAAVPTTLRSKGKLFTPGHEPLSSTVAAGLTESVGNPYASAIDLRNLVPDGGLVETYIVWDPRATGAYGLGSFTTLTKNPDGNFYATPQSTSYGAGSHNFIESGQAFLIQATDISGSITFTENAKVSGSNAQLLRGQGGQGRQAQLRTNLFVGTGSNLTLADGNLIQYDATYSNDLDVLDARKMTNTSENLGLGSNGKTLAVERRAPIVETDTVFFKISGMRVQPYKFEFLASDLTEFGVEGIIEDSYLEIKTPLCMEGKTEYSFTIENKPGSYAADRFRIVFKEIARPLPLSFVSIKATQEKDDIVVDWKVENEANIKEYDVEKSIDGNRFMKASALTALNTGAGSYNWLDKDVNPGWNYYRIKSIDQSGKLSYSEVVRVMIEVVAPLITVYPNPIVNGVINVHLVNQPAGNYKLRLLNAVGQTMVSKLVTRDKGTSIEPLTWNYKLARGNYRIEITKPDGGVKLITVIY